MKATVDRFRARFRACFQRKTLDDDFEEELAVHLDMLTEENVKAGYTSTEARRRAKQQMGGLEQTRELHRETRGLPWLEQLARDLKFGARQLLGSKGFSIVALLTLGLSIGACVTIFSAIDAVLLRPLPYPNPDRLVSVWETTSRGDNSISGGAFRDWRDNSQLADSIVLHSQVSKILQTEQGPIRLYGREVTSGFLDTLGLSPLRGRGFELEESTVGGNNNVVMLTEELWHSRFDSDESLIGKSIILNTIPHEVIGVLPVGAWILRDEDFFVPAVLNPIEPWRHSRSNHWANALARLKPGVTVDRFNTELRSIKDNLNNEYPPYKQDWSVIAYSLQEQITRPIRPAIFILTGAVTLVLLIACVNVANLLLARGANRSRELAMRAALGASGRRITQQLLTESMLLAGLGGSLGILLSIVGIRLIQPLALSILPQSMNLQLDWRTAAAAIGIACGSGLIFGLIPAWKSRVRNLDGELKTGGRSASGRARSQSVLVIAEVALTVALLACSGLLLRDFSKALAEDPGFKPENTFTFELSLPREIYETPEKCAAFINTAIERIRAVPGVDSVGSASISTLQGGGMSNYTNRMDQPGTELDHLAFNHYVGGDFFQAMGAQLISGRFLNQRDGSKLASRAAVIDQKLAKALFGDDDPIGQYIRGGVDGNTWEIVGVVADMKIALAKHDGAIFLPHSRYPYSINITVRSHGDSNSIIELVRDQISSIDAGIPLANLRTLGEARDNYFAPDRLIISLIMGFAIVATLLACIGLYGVMSYSISMRNRELSIRRCLGATSRGVISLVIKDGGTLTAIGLGIGLVFTIGAGRLLSHLLYHISSYDPMVLFVTTAIIAVVSLVSCWLPARRATRIDPNSALRSD